MEIILSISDWLSAHKMIICISIITFCFGFLLAMDLYSEPEDRILFFTKD